ncbi:hypothetical protein BG015_003253 [Linnemannia schmuckeri]|uniref:Uncharacterized protein n=1 Tax=Linnemannia schmuckeri TaxID=64567 RepID=A0A9P5S621_9FUNG|nr:hypothetical protein BG015_003253 [Linnemannia schmuckeri]
MNIGNWEDEGGEFAALDLDSKIVASVYLDKGGKVVYMAQGPTVPTPYKDMLVLIEDLKDAGSTMAQFLLNKLALEGPDALEDAKNDPNMIMLLDGLFGSASGYYEERAALEAKVT